MSTILTIIYAILMFCVLIFIHEFGHFIAAKKNDVKVNQFAVGMGPVLWKKQKGETLYSIRALPIGGFCAMEGEDEDSSDPRAFNNKAGWRKAIIVCAGAFMNVLLAVILMIAVVFTLGTATTTVGAFVDGNHAEGAGMRAGDRIVRVQGQKIDQWEEVSGALQKVDGDSVSVTVERDGGEVDLQVPLMEQDGRKMIGISPKMERHLGSAIIEGPKLTWYMTTTMYSTLKQMVTGDVSSKDLSGPVGIVYMVGQSSKQGLVYFLYLVALISLNLGIINMLPLPALDGGRLLFIIIRGFTGKAITDQMEGRVHFIGLMLLFALMIYVTWNDIGRFILPFFR